MQGNDNFVRIFKQRNKDAVKLDPKRNKLRDKDLRRKLRRLKEKELDE